MPHKKASFELPTSVRQKSDNESEQTSPRFMKKQGLSISLHTNGNIISRCLWCLVVKQNEPLLKHFPRDPPSGWRDTACQDFQRVAAENAMRQEWFISVSPFSRISGFRYYFNLLPYFRTHTNKLVHRICFVWECVHRVGKKQHKRHAPWGCITPFMISLSEWVSADSCW